MKMFVIVRADLDPGSQAAQSAHALRLFGEEHQTIDRYWYAKSNNLVLLSVPNEAALKHLASRAADAGFACSSFREPDFDDTVTAITIEPDGYKLVSNLPLALKAKPQIKAA
jgi:peptidyl-tRNA hydrolase